MSRYAISDIHGCARSFEALLDKVGLAANDELYLLGDYIDRGPDSRGVIDRIRALQQAGQPVTCLMGNHEQMLLRSRMDLRWYRTWMLNGGRATLESFEVQTTSEIPEDYTEWLVGLAHYCETPDYFMVHAGLDFRQENPLEDTMGMLWSRDWHDHIDRDWLGGRAIVHGHTPQTRDQLVTNLQKMDQQAWINIDGGCVFGQLQGFGQLCAFDLDKQTLTLQEAIEDELK